LAGGVVALASPILLLFGPEFGGARPALYILASTQLFKSAIGPVGYFLDMTGHQVYNARAFAATTVLGLLLNLIAIPRLGIVGAAIANLLSWMTVMLWLHREVARRVGVRASIVYAIRRPRLPRGDS
jgi:O-antigen/teichoic acid export membrane protein